MEDVGRVRNYFLCLSDDRLLIDFLGGQIVFDPHNLHSYFYLASDL